MAAISPLIKDHTVPNWPFLGETAHFGGLCRKYLHTLIYSAYRSPLTCSNCGLCELLVCGNRIATAIGGLVSLCSAGLGMKGKKFRLFILDYLDIS